MMIGYYEALRMFPAIFEDYVRLTTTSSQSSVRAMREHVSRNNQLRLIKATNQEHGLA